MRKTSIRSDPNLVRELQEKRPSKENVQIDSEDLRNVSKDSLTESNQTIVEQDLETLVEVKTKNRRCLWRANSKIRIRYEFFIIILATINGFQVPYNFAFGDSFESNPFSDVFNALFDFLFIMDVIINFRTSYINVQTGEEIDDWKRISLNYIKGKFWVDLIASLPLDFISFAVTQQRNNSLSFNLISLLKLVRVLRLSRLITYMSIKSDVKISLKLAKLIFFVIIYIHCLGCLWFFIVKQDEVWVPPLDANTLQTDLYFSSAIIQYWTSLYHSILMLWGNDIMPKGWYQLIFVSIAIFFGAIVNANIFGNIAVVYQSLNRKASNFEEKIEFADETMKNLKINETLQEQVNIYLNYTRTSSDHQQELDKFLSMLSPSLKQQVTRHIFYDSIIQNPLFSDHKEIVSYMLNDLVIKLFLPEDEIIRQFESAEDLYIVSKGEWDVYVRDANKIECFTSTVKCGGYFGEVALLK